MPITAKLRYLRIAPRKVRLVADIIRGKSVEESQAILSFVTKKAALPLLKLLNSAVASARNNYQLDSADLLISKITVDEGPKYKRWQPRARGQAYEIQKKTSHIILVLEEIREKSKKAGKKVEKLQKVKEEKIISKQEKTPKTEKPKFKPEAKDSTSPGGRTLMGKRIFRRKSF